MGDACSNMVCTLVMEDGCQKSKRQSSNMKLFGAQRRRETAKPLQFLELMETVSDSGGNSRQQSASVRCQKKFTGHKEGQFPEICDVVSTLFSNEMQDWNKLYCSYDTYSSSLIFQKPALIINLIRT
jgi:hypothetical protein